MNITYIGDKNSGEVRLMNTIIHKGIKKRRKELVANMGADVGANMGADVGANMEEEMVVETGAEVGANMGIGNGSEYGNRKWESEMGIGNGNRKWESEMRWRKGKRKRWRKKKCRN